MHPRTHTHLNEESRLCYVSKDKDTRNSQALLTSLSGPQPNRDPASQDPGNPKDGQMVSSILELLLLSQAEHIKLSFLKGLLSLRTKTNFGDIVATRNNSNQTLAHISVLNNYISLLKQLVEWRIDFTVADVSGFTALHSAYQKEDRESIRILLRGGAFTAIADKLGRFPRDLAPKGSDLADWVNRV